MKRNYILRGSPLKIKKIAQELGVKLTILYKWDGSDILGYVSELTPLEVSFFTSRGIRVRETEPIPHEEILERRRARGEFLVNKGHKEIERGRRTIRLWYGDVEGEKYMEWGYERIKNGEK